VSIEFTVTRDPRLLEQYYQLREQCFRKVLGIPDFDGSEEDLDRTGHILIAEENGRCMGGARISKRLPLQEHLDELELAPEDCCMWERFVLDPSARQMQLGRAFLWNMIEVSRSLGYRHAVTLSCLHTARLYRICHQGLGVDFQIHRHVPEYENGLLAKFKHYLSVAHLQEQMPKALELPKAMAA
jgi:N-acyl-L-homoserine lactone synthetase